MRDLLESAAQRAIAYLEGLPARRVSPSPEAVRALQALYEPLPDQPSDPEEVLRTLDEFASPTTMAMAGPRFFGFVIGGALPTTVAARWLADAWDQNTVFHQITPAVSALEEIALNWLVELFALPKKTCGAFVTGATMANFSALAAARHAVLSHSGWDVEAQGLFGAPSVTVVVGEEAHPTLFKSLGLLGMGRKRVVRVPVDSQGRMQVEALPTLEPPAIVCTQVGNVNTGAFDPVMEISEKAHKAGAWVHVDGAFGLWAAAVPSLSHLTRGVEKADSWATDAHKMLNVPYDCGLAFVSDSDALRAAMAVTADYLPPTHDRRDPSDYTPELSRRARGVEVWAALRSLGRQGLADMVARMCRHAKHFAQGLEKAGYQVLNQVMLNQVLVSFGDAETTNRVIAAIQQEGTCWCGGTIWQGQTAMRISVSSWATTDADVEVCLEAMIRAAEESGA